MTSQLAIELLGDSYEQVPGGPYDDRDLVAACGEVRGYCGWRIAPRATETLPVSGLGGQQLLLPTLALHEALSVHLVAADGALGDEVAGWRPITGGRLYRSAGWPRGVDNLLVEAVHGFDEFPEELLGVVAERARAIGAGLVPGVQADSKTVGSVVRYRQYAASGAGWSVAATGALERYRLVP